MTTQTLRQPIGRELRVRPIKVARAEDGAGATVAAKDPRALDVVADYWPGRALDPVLRVGRLRFYRYNHPSKQVLRFVVSDVALLTPGVEVTLQYGNDVSSRTVITRALKLSVKAP